MQEHFTLNLKTTAYANEKMNNKTVKNLWNSFTLTEGEIEIIPTEQFIFKIGNTEVPTLEEGSEYALTVDSNGIAIIGENYGGLMRGFYSLIMKIEQIDFHYAVKYMFEQGKYKIKNRMIFYCIFPETDLYFMKKAVRLAALCQYTHVVIEFCGMLKYDCLKELAWPHAYTKEEAKSLINDCHELGIEPIPTFNQLGHASGARECYGKHVILEQNPKLQYLFTPDGWAWNITSAVTKELLRNIRKELYEVFGEGSYIHIGCDEAYHISKNENLRKLLPQYLNEITNEIEAEGRRPMLWMDMLLEKDAFKDCYSVGEPNEAEQIRNATAKSTVFVDWQYDSFDVPIPSLEFLKNSGRDVMGAPWFNPVNYNAQIESVAELDLHGIMLTTWHTLKNDMQHIFSFAKLFGANTFFWSEYSNARVETSNILRRVSFEGNTYEDCGWSRTQIEV